MSGKIGIIALPEGWFTQVIKQFDPADLEIFLTTEQLRSNLQASIGTKYRVHLLDQAKVGETTEIFNQCDVLVGDQWQLKRLIPVHVTDPAKVRAVAFAHASDAPPIALTAPSNFLICASQGLLPGIRNHYAYEERTGKFESEAMLRALPYLEGTDAVEYEAGYSGLYHLDPACFTARETRERMRPKLLELLGLPADDDRKIVTCFSDEISDFRQFDEGISGITDEFIVILKTFTGYTKQHAYENVHVIEARQHNDLLRLGSDFIVAGINSGSLSTCMMIGLRAVPYYTQTMHRNAVTREEVYVKGVEEPVLYPLSVENLANRTNGYATELVPAVDGGDSEMLRARLRDASIWDDFDAKVDAWSRDEKAHGDYRKADAAQKTAEMIRAVATEGTLGEDAILSGRIELKS
jgi:hypothetical protein